MVSSSVSTSTRRPFTAKWYQYSSADPKLAIRRSMMSRASDAGWVSFSGRQLPITEHAVRITSMG